MITFKHEKGEMKMKENNQTGLFHAVISTSGLEAFKCREDYLKFFDILKLYKARMNMKIIAYSLGDTLVHLIVHDKEGVFTSFIKRIKDTYGFYYEGKYDTEKLFVDKTKIRQVDRFDQFENSLRYIHSKGKNSLEEYKSYSSGKEGLLSIDFLVSAFGKDRATGKENLMNSLVKEVQEDYLYQLREMEFFPEDKKSKRINRAKKFLKDYLEENKLSKDMIFHETNDSVRIDLVNAFRKKTDLSFRDIGEVLELSHTSIIRLMKRGYELGGQ